MNQEAAQDVILVLGSYSGLRESVRSFFFLICDEINCFHRSSSFAE